MSKKIFLKYGEDIIWAGPQDNVLVPVFTMKEISEVLADGKNTKEVDWWKERTKTHREQLSKKDS